MSRCIDNPYDRRWDRLRDANPYRSDTADEGMNLPEEIRLNRAQRRERDRLQRRLTSNPAATRRQRRR